MSDDPRVRARRAAIDALVAEHFPMDPSAAPPADRLPLALPTFGAAEIAEAIDSLLSGWVTMGAKVRAFEERFAAWVGAYFRVAAYALDWRSRVLFAAASLFYAAAIGWFVWQCRLAAPELEFQLPWATRAAVWACGAAALLDLVLAAYCRRRWAKHGGKKSLHFG